MEMKLTLGLHCERHWLSLHLLVLLVVIHVQVLRRRGLRNVIVTLLVHETILGRVCDAPSDTPAPNPSPYAALDLRVLTHANA